MLRVLAELKKRLCRTFKQKLIKNQFVVKTYGEYLVGKSKNRVIVWDREKIF
jgi:hypothetical protein